MKTNILKRKLREGSVCFGTFLTIGNSDVPDMLKHLGFDWFVFDMEHSYISFERVKEMEQAISESDVCPIVRIGEVDQYLVKRALDAGSQGIIVPLVNSAEDARRVVEFATYPPKGMRGAGPGRASSYGFEFGDYIRHANEELLIGVQIETKQALQSVESIVSVEGVDIGFAGPSDLTMSHGLYDDRSNPTVVAAMSKVVDACRAAGKIPGTLAATPDEAKKFRDMGFKFISLGSDAKFLTLGARKYLEVKQT
jgi:2-dehydro-3-deoxyglucarate aldolase